MRILQILPELKVGGVETGTVDLAKYLISHGHQAVVVSNGGELVQDLERVRARHYSLPVHKKSFLYAFRCISALEKIIKNEQIDIVHARSRVPAWIAFFVCRKTDTAFITTCHGYYATHFFSRVMSWAKLIIVPSMVIGRHMINDFKVPGDSIRCIARSVDLDKFNFPQDEYKPKTEKIIAIIGRLTPLKGHTYFLKSMAKVIRTAPYVRIWIVGDAHLKKESYKQELLLLVRRLGLTSYVEFLGNRKDIPQLLSKIDCLVFSSTVPESFGRVIVEAQAARVPVVATKVGGVVEIIEHEKTGLLVLPKDTEAMAREVLRVLRDKQLARTIIEEARKKLETHYTLDQMASQTIQVYQELLNHLNILVIKLSSLGDVVLVIPSLRALRSRYPKARIYCLVSKEASPILDHCPYIDGMIVIDIKDKEKSWWSLLKIARKLRRYHFDKIIDFQNNRKSHLLSFLSFPRDSYGYHNGKWSWLLSRHIPNDKPHLPPVSHQFQILKLLGIQDDTNESLELWPSKGDERKAQQLLDSEWLGNNKNIIGINLAASQKWESKNWPLKYIAKICDLLSAKNFRVILTGVEDDREVAKELIKAVKSKPANLVGKTDLMELAALIKRCLVYVTCDSAPLHLAVAVKTPVVALFGPTDPKRHMPYAKEARIIHKNVRCAPCYSARCRIVKHTCMKNISPEEVLTAIEDLIKEA